MRLAILLSYQNHKLWKHDENGKLKSATGRGRNAMSWEIPNIGETGVIMNLSQKKVLSVKNELQQIRTQVIMKDFTVIEAGEYIKSIKRLSGSKHRQRLSIL